MASGRTVFYQGVGDRLTHWDVDVEAATLTPRVAVTLPSNIQYVWPHPSRKFLYVSTSDAASGSATKPGKVHRLCCLRIDATGALSLHGEPAVLPQRPIHNSLDISGNYALTCYNNPSNLTVHRINANGTVGEQIQQTARLDFGIFAHQILATPSNHSVIMVTRGNKAEGGKSEEPGALKIYSFKGGQLSPLANLRVGGKGGLGYGPRHLDFHPTRPWVYVSVESQNELHMHELKDDNLSPEPLYNKLTTAGTYEIHFPQVAGGIHVHPSGKTVYVANRGVARPPNAFLVPTPFFSGERFLHFIAGLLTGVATGPITPLRGGENNIAVFSIDPKTGEPTLIQHAHPHSFHVRTFSVDPTGKMMVAASIVAMDMRVDGDIRHVPAGLTVFRIEDDGRLTFVRKYNVDVRDKFQWWTGFVDLA
jgi:6-phosphogluconolactonase